MAAPHAVTWLTFAAQCAQVADETIAHGSPRIIDEAGPQADTAAAAAAAPGYIPQEAPWLPSLRTASIPALGPPRNLDFKTWRALLVRVVKQERVADVRIMIETGERCWCGPEADSDEGSDYLEARAPLENGRRAETWGEGPPALIQGALILLVYQ